MSVVISASTLRQLSSTKSQLGHTGLKIGHEIRPFLIRPDYSNHLYLFGLLALLNHSCIESNGQTCLVLG